MQCSILTVSGGDVPEVVIQTQENGAEPFVIGGTTKHLFPLFPEYFGELVVVTGFKQGYVSCGQHQEMGRHIFLPSSPPLPLLESFLVGRLAATWKDEPQIEKFIMFYDDDSPEWVEPVSLSCLLARFSSCLDHCEIQNVFLGTSAALQELERCVPKENFRVHRNCAEAMLRLSVSQAELALHAPFIAALIPKLIARDKAAYAQLDLDLKGAVACFQVAQKDFAAERLRITSERGALRKRESLYDNWQAKQQQLQITA